MSCSAGCYWTLIWLAKQATNKLASENMDNFTALYTSYLRFTFAELFKFMLLCSGSKTAAGTIDQVQIA